MIAGMKAALFSYVGRIERSEEFLQISHAGICLPVKPIQMTVT